MAIVWFYVPAPYPIHGNNQSHPNHSMDRSDDNSDGGDVPPTVTARPVAVGIPLAVLTEAQPPARQPRLRAPPRPLVPAAYRMRTPVTPQAAPVLNIQPILDPRAARPVSDAFTRQIADFVDAFAVLSARAPEPAAMKAPALPPVAPPPPFAPLPSIAAVSVPSLLQSADPLPRILRPVSAQHAAVPSPPSPAAAPVMRMAVALPHAPVPQSPAPPPLAPRPVIAPGPLRADPVRRPVGLSVPVPAAKPAVDRARPLARKLLRFAGYAVAAYLGLIVVLMIAYRLINPPMSSLMVQHWASGGEVIQEWASIDQISPQIVRAVLLSEDGRFCQHRGVDLLEMQAAIERAGDGGVPRGASTISMQVIKNLFLWPSKSYVRKAIEIPLTYLMELLWPKRRIMEVYLNIAEWGPGIFGVESAAKFHFNKSASRLNEREAAQLAVALPNPYSRDAGDPGPQTRRLASDVQTRMRNAYSGQTTCVLGSRTASR